MKPVRSPLHWAALEETGVLWGMRFMLLVYRLFGRWAFRLLLHPVIAYYFLAVTPARNASRQYLRRLGETFPELGITDGWLDSYRHFLAFGENLLDKLAAWTDKLDPTQVEFHNRQLLLDLLARQQGAMLLSGHIGNPEICQALASLRGQIRLNILVHTKHAAKFNRLLGGMAKGGNIEFIQVTELNPAIAILLQDKLRQGEFVVMVGDRTPVYGQGRTVRAAFLGEDAEFPQGPYYLASLLQCPVYTFFSYPEGGRYHIHVDLFAESIHIPRRDPERNRALSELASRYASILECHCRRAPLQWFNFYPFWGQAKAGLGAGCLDG